MLFNAASLVLAAAAAVEAYPGNRGPFPHAEWEKFKQIGKGYKAAKPTPAPVPEDSGDCAVSYGDVTTTIVVTKEVQVWETTTVYEEPCEATTTFTEGDSTVTSTYSTTSTITSTYTESTTVDVPGTYPAPGSPDEPTEGYPTDYPEPTEGSPTEGGPSDYPVPTTSDKPGVPYPVPGGNTTVIPSGSVPVPSGTEPITTSSSTSSAVPEATCPAVWRQITQEMMGAFAGCNRPARSSIRFAFHDAAGWSSKTEPYGPASGGADGSILYSDEEVNRAGNQPLPDVANIFRGVYANFENEVSAADFVQFAGVIGVRMCGGPIYKTVIGREDDTTPCPEFMMPAAFGVNASYEALTQLWADKGISERELGALLGAHSVSVAFAQQANGIPPNSPQDSTPAVMDMNYYKETQAQASPAGVFKFDSDINLSNATTVVGQAFTDFSAEGGLNLWRQEYAAAAYKLSIMGLSAEKEASLIDCTHIIEELTADV